MAFGAFLYATFVAPIAAYVVGNVLKFALKAVAPLLFLAVFAAEWATGTVWAKCQLVAVVVSAVVLTMELTGNLNLALPATPVAPVKPTK